MRISALLMAASPLLLSSPAAAMDPKMAALTQLKQMTGRFARTEIKADISRLPANEVRVLAKLIAAAKVMDALFLRQAWAGNEAMLLTLASDHSELGRARLHAFLLNKGPWDRLDANRSFISGAPEKPPAANFYPAGATKGQVELWLKSLPDAQRALATGFFTTIRRSPGGQSFQIVPYSVEYQGELAEAAQLLRQAAELTSAPTLRDFLNKRADAFLSNDYYASDLAWMELDAAVEPTIGPYEVYEDEWFNAKAAFEAHITIRDDAGTQKLAKFSSELQDIENHLPIDSKLRNPRLGAMAPIRVVNEVFNAGDANHGVQTSAFNLPNDERITKEKGTKRVMLKNVQEAKFEKSLIPIARRVLASADLKNVSFDAYFTFILMHELMHGLGPHDISIQGRATTVRHELQETYSALEEAKADISGMFALQHLVDKGVIDRSMERTMYVTYLATSFRGIRFGLTEAHGKGCALQINYLLDAGGFVVRPDGSFSVEANKIKAAVAALTGEIMTLQAQGNRDKARDLLSKLGVIRPDVQKAVDRLSAIPVDIEPQFTTAEKLLASEKL